MAEETAAEAAAAISELVRLASANWFGKDEPSARSVLDWFLAAFPMKRDEDRRQLESLRDLV